MRALLLVIAALPAIAFAGERPVLAILDFESPDGGKLGARVARRLNRRATEANTHTLVDRDDVRLALKQAGLEVKHTGKEREIQRFAREQLGAHLVMWGKASPRGGRAFHAAIRCMRTLGEAKPYLDVERECANFAALANFYTDFEPILLEKRTTLRKLYPVSEKARASNLVKNYSFEQGTWHPAHWTKIDGLTSFWVDRDDGKGKCLMCDTEVLISQAEPWWKRIRAGKATARDAPRKIPVGGNIYATVGGLDGVRIFGELIPVKPKMRYRLTADIKANWGGIFFPKAFVKGYADLTDEFTTQKRELYRAWLGFRTETKGREWETFSRTFNPTLRTPRVKWMRVMLYSYWPLGKYYWDNVIVTEEAIED